MPGKSRHGKKKRSARSKKLKLRQSPPATIAQQQAIAQTYKPVASSRAAAPSGKMPTPASTPIAVQHPYIVTELQRIGILAVIILAILVVLALVLP